MRYVLLTYNAPESREIWAAMTETERRAEEDEYVRLVESMQDSNAYVGATELDPATAGQKVRVRNGERMVIDSPAVQSAESLTGYFVIDVDSVEAAIEWAAKIPNARSGSVEVRRVDEDELAGRLAAAGGAQPA